MFKSARRKYRRYHSEHQFDYPALFFSIGLVSNLLKVLAVAVVTYAMFLVIA